MTPSRWSMTIFAAMLCGLSAGSTSIANSVNEQRVLQAKNTQDDDVMESEAEVSGKALFPKLTAADHQTLQSATKFVETNITCKYNNITKDSLAENHGIRITEINQSAVYNLNLKSVWDSVLIGRNGQHVSVLTATTYYYAQYSNLDSEVISVDNEMYFRCSAPKCISVTKTSEVIDGKTKKKPYTKRETSDRLVLPVCDADTAKRLARAYSDIIRLHGGTKSRY